jgi:solute:Na+ symporter, SSS family
VSLHLALVIAYAAAITFLGLWTARYIRTSSDFFVAGRGLGTGLVFASMLAAKIGAGATAPERRSAPPGSHTTRG